MHLFFKFQPLLWVKPLPICNAANQMKFRGERRWPAPGKGFSPFPSLFFLFFPQRYLSITADAHHQLQSLQTQLGAQEPTLRPLRGPPGRHWCHPPRSCEGARSVAVRAAGTQNGVNTVRNRENSYVTGPKVISTTELKAED